MTHVTAISYSGKDKNQSDDTVLVNEQCINNAEVSCDVDALQIICVADGVGGNAGGQKASMFITEELGKSFNKMRNAEAIYHWITDANDKLLEFAKMNSGEETMATTFSGLIAGEDGIYIAHIGNTRIYRLQGAYLRQLTEDQTTFQLLISRFGYAEAENINKNEIYACMGGGSRELFSPFFVERVPSVTNNNLFMITSDGVHDYVPVEVMEDLLKSFETDQERAEAIAVEALRNGSKDDRSIVLVRY